MTQKESKKTSIECCPKFDQKLWDEKSFDWKNKKFIKDKVFTFFYMPLNFGSAMKRLDCAMKKSKSQVQDYLCLSEHTSKWNMNLYLAVNNEVAEAENTTISGKFFSKVYEGKFSDTGKWMKDFDDYAKKHNFKIEKKYMWYTTCPKCAKKYGKNYVVIFGKLS